jgi:hypothetical protein
MNIGILGTGGVARAIAAKLVSLNHGVTLGTRNVHETMSRAAVDTMGNAPFRDWHSNHAVIKLGTYADAAAYGEILVNATSGSGSIAALHAAGEKNIGGKILLDISNPLDFSKGFPPSLSIVNTDSLGELIQRTFPSVKVVKTLNTLSNPLMVNPSLVNGGDHTIFLSGNDVEAKKNVLSLLTSFGWNAENVIDLGDITSARGTEQILPIWVRLFGKLQTPMFQFKIVK